MSNSYASERPAGADSPAPPATEWVGIVVFAGVMLLSLGVFQLTEGVVALVNEDYYVVTAAGLPVDLDYTAWGWVHLVLGLLAVAAGGGVFLGQLWARIIGILIAFLGALMHFVFLAASPFWCTILLGMDVLIIFALAAHGRDIRRP
ncbi:DUF7144 family membrane protein [Actinoplanes sp. HUAS TT8]|uniref:DUF7144 family membrane protein n=1 Tax=Actinoplanes sp. HUAS TT8 TaxID=3447453 RepID=UPI003F520E31